jgi:hypothetical protein
MTTVVDGRLRELLADHHARFSPLYGGFLSDHGPMAALALFGLGAPPDSVCDYLKHYQQRLSPAADAPEGYPELLAATLQDVQKESSAAILSRDLPGLISGWARDAYHPLIRTAYGVEFGIDEEVAAGLAYLKWCGPDELVQHHAENAKAIDDPGVAFSKMQRCASSVSADRNFTQALTEVIAHPGFAEAAMIHEDLPAVLSRRALEVFATTHDFFALHLVTGAHAYRILYPFAGELRDPIFALGLLGGYAAVGASEFEPMSTGEQITRPDAWDAWRERLLTDSSWPDEHDVKLAHSAVSQADHYVDPTWTRIASDYLESRAH